MVVLDAALRFLEARHRSVEEVRRRLTSAGYREELITAAVERLADLGMLNDESFATQWVESRDRARPRGERALRAELAQRGVDRATVDAVLAERRDLTESGRDGVGRETEADDIRSPDSMAAERLLERRGRALARGADPRARRQRAYALLVRNGFDSSTATDVAARWAKALGAGTGNAVSADSADSADQDDQGPSVG